MAFCTNCGKELKGKVNYCSKCGNKITKVKEKKVEETVEKNVKKILNTSDTSSEYNKSDISSNLALALLSYLGVLALIPYFTSKDSKFVKYHATQGMNLLIVWGMYTVLSNMLGLIKVSRVVFTMGSQNGIEYITPFWINFPITLVGILLVVLSIMGIVYVCEGKAKELPIINKIKIVK